MKKKKGNNWGMVAVLVIVIILMALFWFFRRHRPPVQQEVPGNYPVHKRGGPCPGETQTFEAKDGWMKGILDPGQKFDVIMNYYDCNKPEIGDVVYYSLSPDLPPVVKRIVAAGGDHFKLARDENQSWDLMVNGEFVKMVTDPSRKYFFGSTNPATLSLYEKSEGGVLKPDEVILFSTWSPGDKDSGLFGVANVVDILGKVDVKGDHPSAAAETAPTPEPTAAPVKSKSRHKTKGQASH